MELVSGVIDSTKTFPNPKYGVEICVFIGSSLYNSSSFWVCLYFHAPNVSIFSYGRRKLSCLSPYYDFFFFILLFFLFFLCFHHSFLHTSPLSYLTLLHLVTSLLHSSLFPPSPISLPCSSLLLVQFLESSLTLRGLTVQTPKLPQPTSDLYNDDD